MKVPKKKHLEKHNKIRRIDSNLFQIKDHFPMSDTKDQHLFGASIQNRGYKKKKSPGNWGSFF